ncbi:hypothetical protein OG462_44485 [Streptomyces sp. NBC_01077]|uniref:hypothetical protein n=1 Tax=Streptomyces sp. NBC_01077 TaxID=2903746 RepID=UPI003862DFEC|nr:hypothetical protein OG462_00520 [Streptomyces sp. NBC_01077]WSV43758.1 hypothetical protein OG462_44485 [Streptomyces sp. NBC_01077]
MAAIFRRFPRQLSCLQERIEASVFGRILISSLVVALLFPVLERWLPPGPVRTQAESVGAPIRNAGGVDQNWGMFSPNPPRHAEGIDVIVTLSNGREVTWNVPHGDPLLSHLWTYRWQKLKESAVRHAEIRPALALWVAEQAQRDGARATHVRIVLSSRSLPPPGSAVTPQESQQILYDKAL